MEPSSYLSPKSSNAALSGEQRDHPSLNLATSNTEADLNLNCQALRIRLKCLVM
ncbi:hypothetical protein [Vibrio gallaecicus]|uniref:hypothetical protein n=1 Tax=Vibrio gallaecicus TaxID=552386 RepID=UPI0025B4B1A1|nr:hypothetical protein [Vibrio gallaecicus]MDN3617224.1 hypothetical protein [Vibrio gallaecicus]